MRTVRLLIGVLLVFTAACPAPMTLIGADGGKRPDAGAGGGAGGGTGGGSGGGNGAHDAGAQCEPCMVSTDCNQGASCVQLLGSNVCGTRCTGVAGCDPGAQCLPTTALDGIRVSICVLPTGNCGTAPCAGGCGPEATCDVMSGHCTPIDAGLMSDAGVPASDAGAPRGTVGINGGSVDRLFFAVLGDTRPSLPNDTAHYPTATITGIFQAMQAMNPRPQFAVGTGDYQFAYSTSSEAAKQVGFYMGARAYYSNTFFPAMGNHECTGATNSNCAGTQTDPYKAFMSSMMQPLSRSLPYFTFDVNDLDGKWSAKFIIAACNAWDSTQKEWLDTQLARTTTYTFIARHEPLGVAAPCTAEMDAMLAAHPYTMFLSGHSHTFAHNANELIEGTGGAPLSGNAVYGYATVEQLPDGTLRITQYDSGQRKPVASYTLP